MIQDDIIAVFPLPNLVFFPGTRLPLHIFEPRYCQMIKETVNNRQLIGMFLLQPGWQQDYYGNPPIYPIGCAGELIDFETLPEDKFNIVLRGIYRARCLETVQEMPYRKVRVQILPEKYDPQHDVAISLKEALLDDLRRLAVYLNSPDSELLLELNDLAEIVNSTAMALQLDVDIKMELLTENDVCKRAELIHQLLTKQISLFQWTRQFDHLRPVDPTRN